mgnify:CR=1 FL=1
MIIGVPKEIKNNEFRVGLTPASAYELVHAGHQIFIETGAGLGSGYSDKNYIEIGAEIAAQARDIFSKSKLIIKVKEPLKQERARLNSTHTLFTYLHLAPDAAQTDDLLKSGSTCIAYETVTDEDGHLPLLTPMSEVAGRMSIQAGAHCLEKSQHGQGLLLSGVPGVQAANVIILGGGVVGSNAAKIAVGMGANVFILDKSLNTLRALDHAFGNKIQTLFSTRHSIENCLRIADLVIGAVLVPGAKAPKLVSRDDLKLMKAGAAVVDVAVDQGGCFETTHATTHDAPTFIEEDIVHYCVANMPGALARTSTQALNNATLPFILELANKGVKKALSENHHLLQGLNISKSQITCPAVGIAQNKLSITPEEGLALF